MLTCVDTVLGTVAECTKTVLVTIKIDDSPYSILYEGSIHVSKPYHVKGTAKL